MFVEEIQDIIHHLLIYIVYQLLHQVVQHKHIKEVQDNVVITRVPRIATSMNENVSLNI